jgi:hypothetical protein
MTPTVQHYYFFIVPHQVLNCYNESGFECDHQSNGASIANHAFVNYQSQSQSQIPDMDRAFQDSEAIFRTKFRKLLVDYSSPSFADSSTMQKGRNLRR